MGVMAPTFWAVLVLCVVRSNGLRNDVRADPPAPKFTDRYSTKGTIIIPYAEIEEPFYAWFDRNASNSRIDYYGGMVKTYQLGKLGEFGSSVKIAPVTTEKEANKNTCLQVNGTSDLKIDIQSILPDLTDFKRIGEEVIDGVPCEKWRLMDPKGDKINKYTMWIRYKKFGGNAEQIAVPVRYEMRGFNSLLGSHYDHYYLEYEFFSNDLINPSVFEIPEDLKCESFPGPGSDHIITFNPMAEFIHGEESHVDTAFGHFKRRHSKDYNDTEHGRRREIFKQNFRFIHSTNRANKGYQLAVNHLADRTDLEMRVLRGKLRSNGTSNGGSPFPYDARSMVAKLPKEIDWRIMGAVTPVKDQSICGSCWSFGTTGAIEGAFFVKYGKLIRVSQQALIDCSWGYGNNGCDGGEDFRSYQWMMKHGGIPTEDEYGPYYGQDGYCHIKDVKLSAPIKGYVNVTSGDENALKLAVVKHGPISVAIDASHKSFSFYSHGVYYEPKCGNQPENLDHAVLVVGYGTLQGKNYWLVKNSWSNYWGNDGYVLMSSEKNNCGVTTDPTYVEM